VLALGIPLHIVTSGIWKRHFSLNSEKEKSRALALQTWPSRADLFKRKKDENRAEASLIALYGCIGSGCIFPQN
jgi:crossover junction endodeoxyribonuclease RuvC